MSNQAQKQEYCPNCKADKLFIRQKPNHILHLLLTLVTLGLWLPIWILVLIANFMKPFQCPECGHDSKTRANTQSQTLQVAKYQKKIVWCFLVLIILTVLLFVTPSPAILLLSIGNVIFLYYTYKLSASLGYKMPARILWCIGVLIPVVDLLFLLEIVHKASEHIKSAGFKVGLLGADTSKIQLIDDVKKYKEETEST